MGFLQIEENFISSSRDGSIVFVNGGGVWTSTSGFTLYGPSGIDGGISGDGNIFATEATGVGQQTSTVFSFYDLATNLLSQTGLTEYQHALASPLAGMKFNDAGSLLYVPVLFGISSESVSFIENAVDIYDVRRNELRERVILGEQFPNSYSNLIAIDPTGRSIFLVTNVGLTIVSLDAVPLSIGSVTPSNGTGGTTITIRGSGFVSGTTASFNDAAGAVTFLDGDTLNADIPANLQAGGVSITLTNPDGSAYALDDAFTVN
jgi:hypothetical protein